MAANNYINTLNNLKKKTSHERADLTRSVGGMLGVKIALILKQKAMSKEQVNHPEHYNQYPIETIDMMVAVWGKENTIIFCLMTAFKYRMRLGHKDNVEQDLAKEKWYLDKTIELKQTL